MMGVACQHWTGEGGLLLWTPGLILFGACICITNLVKTNPFLQAVKTLESVWEKDSLLGYFFFTVNVGFSLERWKRPISW